MLRTKYLPSWIEDCSKNSLMLLLQSSWKLGLKILMKISNVFHYSRGAVWLVFNLQKTTTNNSFPDALQRSISLLPKRCHCTHLAVIFDELWWVSQQPQTFPKLLQSIYILSAVLALCRQWEMARIIVSKVCWAQSWSIFPLRIKTVEN